MANGTISIEPLDKIHRRICALAQIGDMELQLEAGLEFHAQMRVLSGNAVAARLLDQLMIGLERYRQLVTGTPARGEEIVEEHQLILDAVAAGDAPRAAWVARAHIEQARRLYREVLTQRFAVPKA